MVTLSSFSIPKSLLGLRRSNSRANIPAISVSGIGSNTPFQSRFRFVNGLRSGTRQRLYTLFASKTNPSDKDSLQKAEENETSRGPPLLAILAGFVAFSVICWIVGSIVMWLIGLIVSVR